MIVGSVEACSIIPSALLQCVSYFRLVRAQLLAVLLLSLRYTLSHRGVGVTEPSNIQISFGRALQEAKQKRPELTKNPYLSW